MTRPSKRRLAAILILGMLVPVASWAQQHKAVAALKLAAQQGNSQAQLAYGKYLEKSSPDEAFKWLQAAGKQGIGEAWYRIAYALGRGKGYYEKAAALGYVPAFDEALDELLFRAAGEADVDRAEKIARLARKFHLRQGDKTGEIRRSLRTVDLCYAAGSPKIPASDRADTDEIMNFRKHKGQCLDYHAGLGVGRDDVAYRKCLLSAEYVDNNALAEIYANGWGVARNTKLAMALVCHGSEVPAELDGLVRALEKRRKAGEHKKLFLFCDHVTSGMSGGRCSAQQEYIREHRRNVAIAKLMSSWTMRDRDLFKQMYSAFQSFVSTHSVNELDMSGTARDSIAIEEETELRNWLVASIHNFEAHNYPEAESYVAADAELNQIYRQIIHAPRFVDDATQSKLGVRTTQRKWLLYRDRFATFAHEHYPGESKQVWLSWLTRMRIAQLRDIASQVLPDWNRN